MVVEIKKIFFLILVILPLQSSKKKKYLAELLITYVQSDTYILILMRDEAQRLEITASEHPNSSDIVMKDDDLSF